MWLLLQHLVCAQPLAQTFMLGVNELHVMSDWLQEWRLPLLTAVMSASRCAAAACLRAKFYLWCM
jgi:hypothetical protein